MSAAAIAPLAQTALRPVPGAMPGARGIAMEGTPSLRLPGQHFAAALFFLAAGAAGLVWIAPELAAGLYPSPRVAGVTHCFTLGWLTMTIFGALYQLLPVALGVPIRSERWGHVSFWMFAPGVALFAGGVAASSALLRHAGIALAAAGIACIVVNVSMSLARVRERDVIWGAIAIALAFLTSTLVLGLVLVENLRTGFLAGARVHVLAVHLHVALLGWVLMMIVGISHRLLPMFLLAHGADMRWTRRSLALLAAGVVALAAGILCGPSEAHRIAGSFTWAGVALVDGGVACFLVQARKIFRARIRPRLDAGLRHVAISLVFLGLAAALGPVVLLRGASHPRLDVVYVMIGLLGGLVMYAAGQFYKIVPFLVWISRFRNDVGRRPVPTVAELYSARVAHIGLAALVLAITAMVAGVALGAAIVVRVGALFFAGGVALFISQMTRVAFARAPRQAVPNIAAGASR